MEAQVDVKDDHSGPARETARGISREQLALAVEALLLTLDRPVPASRMAESLGLSDPQTTGEEPQGVVVSRRRKKTQTAESSVTPSGAATIEAVIADLNQHYESTGRSFRVEAVAGGFRLMTRPEFAPIIAAFHRSRNSGRLSRAAVETLAIIAYKQPITRAHLEAIRGVACGEVLRSLMERRLVVIKGRAEELGRPILYGTSREFLDAFGLASLKDLPTATELQIAP